MPHHFLLDKPYRNPGFYRPGILQHINESRPGTHRYLFNSDACEKIGELLRDCYDLVIANNEFARPPYENIYLEMLDHRRLFATWKNERSALTDMTADMRVGYLINKNFLLTLAEGQAENQTIDHTISMFSIGMNKPQSASLEIFGPDRELQQIIKAAYLTGGKRPDRRNNSPSWDEMQFQVPLHTVKEFSALYDLRPTLNTTRIAQMVNADRWRDMAFMGSGDLMVALAALLLLNQKTDKVTYESVGNTSGLVKGKRVVYKAHTVVNIRLEPKQSVRTLLTAAERSSPVRHEVQGHWVHHGTRVRCEHLWEPLDVSHNRYCCAYCGLKRTWRKEHYRGTAEKGINTKHYNVTR